MHKTATPDTARANVTIGSGQPQIHAHHPQRWIARIPELWRWVTIEAKEAYVAVVLDCLSRS
jgi:hypothetical protein